MRNLEQRFQAASGLSDRRFYNIFYSKLQPSGVMVIGINPGGSSDGSHEFASPTFYEDGSHEYVDMDYRIAQVMRPALIEALGLPNAEALRAIPKTNSFFQRSKSIDGFTKSQIEEHIMLCAPFLREMLEFVRPAVIIVEGAAARDAVVRYQCTNVVAFPADDVWGLRRGKRNRFFRRERATLNATKERVDLLTLGHPSQFGYLPGWQQAVAAVRKAVCG